MKKTAIIHIGSGKTGSTSIQNSLYKSKSENDGVVKYPLVLGSNNQQFRFAFCKLANTPSNIRAQYHCDIQGFENFQNRIKKEFEAEIEGVDDVLISSEFLFLSNLKEIENIKIYLEGLGFNDFKVIVYIREPSSYYLSVAQQALKTQDKIPQPDEFFYAIKRQIENWEAVFFGITVRCFSKDLLKGGDIVLDFQSVLEDFGFGLKLDSMRLNESISAEASQVMQDFYSGHVGRHSDLDKYRVARKVIAKFIRSSSGSGNKPILRNNIREAIMARFNEEVNWVNDRFQLELEVYGESVFVPENCAVSQFKDVVTDFSTDVYRQLKLLMLEISEDERL